jgi:transposase
MRFEGLPVEFSQHDFGQVKVRFLGGSGQTVHFFASRLKHSRWAEVTLVDNEVVETLVRRLAEHFSRFGGIPLCVVFDRPKTAALAWSDDGMGTKWSPTCVDAVLELRFTEEVCWPHQPQQKVRSRAWSAGVRSRFSSNSGSTIAPIWRYSSGSGSTKSILSGLPVLPGRSLSNSWSRSGYVFGRRGSLLTN